MVDSSISQPVKKTGPQPAAAAPYAACGWWSAL